MDANQSKQTNRSRDYWANETPIPWDLFFGNILEKSNVRETRETINWKGPEISKRSEKTLWIWFRSKLWQNLFTFRIFPENSLLTFDVFNEFVYFLNFPGKNQSFHFSNSQILIPDTRHFYKT